MHRTQHESQSREKSKCGIDQSMEKTQCVCVLLYHETGGIPREDPSFELHAS